VPGKNVSKLVDYCFVDLGRIEFLLRIYFFLLFVIQLQIAINRPTSETQIGLLCKTKVLLAQKSSVRFVSSVVFTRATLC